MKGKLQATVAALGVALGLAAANAEVLNRIVASIDGEPVTLYELEEYSRKQSTALAGIAAPGPKDMLQGLITEKLVAKEINAKGIRVRDEDIDGYINRIKSQNRLNDEQLKAALAQQGIAWDQYRQQIKQEIEKIQLLNREIRGRVNVTPEDVERYYEAHKEEYRVPTRVHLRHIVMRVAPDAPDEVALAVRDRLAGIRKRIVDEGEEFAEVAKQTSEDVAAASGGDLGEVEPDKILPEFAEVVGKLEEGEVSEPIRTAAGMHIVKLEKRAAEGYTPVSEVSAGIKDKLYGQALDERYKRWLLEDLKKNHYIEIRL